MKMKSTLFGLFFLLSVSFFSETLAFPVETVGENQLLGSWISPDDNRPLGQSAEEDEEKALEETDDYMALRMQALPEKRGRSRLMQMRPKATRNKSSGNSKLRLINSNMTAGDLVKMLTKIANRKKIQVANKTLRYGISRRSDAHFA